MPVMEEVRLKLKWASVFMACTGAAFMFLSLFCFLFSFNLIKNPSLSTKFAAEVFGSVFLFTIAVIFLIAGIVFLVYAAEFELRL